MESGTFNHNKKIFNLIFKKSKNTELSNLILKEFSSNDIKKYIKDIRACDVKTAKVFFEYKNIIIENYISGMTIDQMLRNNSKDKYLVLRELLRIYNKIEKNENLCLDWNLKNFIYHDTDLYYIDFVPCIYKNKLSESKSYILKEYIESYLDSNITLQGIYFYILKTLLYSLTKEELYIFRKELNNIFDSELNTKINFDTEHPYSIGIHQINEYIDGKIDVKKLEYKLKNSSLEKKINDNFKERYV